MLNSIVNKGFNMKNTTIIILFYLLLMAITGCSQLPFDKASHANSEEGNKASQKGAIKTTGSISGTVTLKNKTGDMSGVSVSLAGLSYGAYTAADGSYKIEHIPPGTYTLIYKKNGYDILNESSVIVKKGQETIKSVLLHQRGLKVLSSTMNEGDLYAAINSHFINFNEIIEKKSANIRNFSLKQGATPIKISTIYHHNNTLLLGLESSLEYSTDYTFSYKGLKGVEGGIVDEPVTIKFRTHGGAPNIIDAAPVSYSRDFPVDRPITIQFDRDMDPTTLNSDTLRLSAGSYSNTQNTTINYNSNTKTVTITPDKIFFYGTVYSLYLNMLEIKDLNGVRLGDYKISEKKEFLLRDWEFETAPFDFTGKMGQWQELTVPNVWRPISLSFDVIAGKSYEITWDDQNDGSGKYSLDCSLYSPDEKRFDFHGYGGSSHDSGYTTPIVYKAQKTGKVYFHIKNKSNITGTIAIKVTELP